MEVLIRIIDRSGAIDDAKRGDVVSICPDGWAWSPAELTNNDWRIISVNILASTALAFLASPTNQADKRRREWMVNLSLLPNPALFTGARTQGIITLTRKQVTDAAVKKI